MPDARCQVGSISRRRFPTGVSAHPRVYPEPMSLRRPNRRSIGAIALAFVGTLPLFLRAADFPSWSPRLPDHTLWPQGRYVYERHCVICHGKYGDGRGDMGRTPFFYNFDINLMHEVAPFKNHEAMRMRFAAYLPPAGV